jgi:hypothetical protein
MEHLHLHVRRDAGPTTLAGSVVLVSVAIIQNKTLYLRSSFADLLRKSPIRPGGKTPKEPP